MKKVIFGVIAAAALLCCSCQSDQCKCTSTTKSGDKTIKTIDREDGKKCSDYNNDGTVGAGGISIDFGVTTKCVNA